MRLWWTPLIMLGSTPVWAQAPALTIEQRLERLERENAALRRQLKAKAAPTAAAGVPTGPEKPKLAAGWTVLVYPRPFKGQEPFPVGSFVAKGGGFRFGEFRNTMPHSGWASFKGEGLFYAYAKGPYTFTLDLQSAERVGYAIKMTCDVTFQIDDTDLIPADQGQFFMEHFGTFNRPIGGAAKLEIGHHQVHFQIGCQYNNGFRGVTADDMFQGLPNSKTVFDNTQLSINVFGPKDRVARPLRENELAHDLAETTTAR